MNPPPLPSPTVLTRRVSDEKNVLIVDLGGVREASKLQDICFFWMGQLLFCCPSVSRPLKVSWLLLWSSSTPSSLPRSECQTFILHLFRQQHHHKQGIISVEECWCYSIDQIVLLEWWWGWGGGGGGGPCQYTSWWNLWLCLMCILWYDDDNDNALFDVGDMSSMKSSMAK